jgi:hypothetical protein
VVNAYLIAFGGLLLLAGRIGTCSVNVASFSSASPCSPGGVASLPAASALNSGYHLAYLIGAGPVLVAIAVALSALRSQAPASRPVCE